MFDAAEVATGLFDRCVFDRFFNGRVAASPRFFQPRMKQATEKSLMLFTQLQSLGDFLLSQAAVNFFGQSGRHKC